MPQSIAALGLKPNEYFANRIAKLAIGKLLALGKSRRCIVAIIACNALQRPAMHCNAVQCNATKCNALQRFAMHCNDVQCIARGYVQRVQRAMTRQTCSERRNESKPLGPQDGPKGQNMQFFPRNSPPWAILFGTRVHDNVTRQWDCAYG